MASAATPDVTVLSVKLAKPQRERVRKLRQGQVDNVSPRVSGYIKKEKDVTDTVGGRQDVKQELAKDTKKEPEEVTVEVKKEIKQEVKRQMQKEVASVTQSTSSLDVKEEVKTATCKVEVKEERETEKGKEVKEESRVDAKEEVKEEVKDEVKEEVMEDVKQVKAEVKEEVMEEMVAEIKNGVKREVKCEIKREDLAWNSQTTRVKQESVEEAQGTCPVKQEEAEEAGSVRPSKRRRISHKRPDISPPSFESRLPEWAEKCLAFQSSGKTWLPTKPCCPASPFLGLAAAAWEGCKEDRTLPCVQRLGKVQFCEFRDFFHENPHHALFNDHGKDSSGSGPVEKAHGPRPEHLQDPAAKQHRAAEMMKMWPWMHDLPTRAWAGHGWLVEEDGMRRLSPTGGGSAMKGLEIFEAFGAVPEESQEAAGASAPSSSGAAGADLITRSFRGLERQSGVQNIRWKQDKACWCVSHTYSGKQKQLHFPISKRMREGLSEDEAVAAALAEAKAHREELVRQGKLQPPKPVTAKASGSTVRGVKCRENGTFRVQITNPRTNKKEEGGTFKTLAEAEAKARELAKKLGLQAESEVVPVDRLAEAPHFEPLGPQPGVKWRHGAQHWRAQCTVNGKNRNFTVKPKDYSEKEVEKAWKQAVAWRKQQEKERERAEKGQKR